MALCFAVVVAGGVVSAAASELTIEQVGAWGGSVDAIHVAQEGDRTLAYIGSGVRLVILDVTDPPNITQLGSVMLEGVVMDLKVRDGYAYVAATPPAWFSILDVRDPAAPFVVTTGVGPWMDTAPIIHHVDLDGSGRWAFVTPRTWPPTRIDISDPASASWGRAGECAPGSYPLFFSGSLAYCLSPHHGRVGAVDYSTCPGTELGWIHIPEYEGATNHTASAVGGDYLYVAGSMLWPVRHSLLFIVDFSDLAAPVLAGIWGDPTGKELPFADALAVSDGRLYWAGSGRFEALGRTLVILDIATDPTSPTLIGEYVSDATFTEIKVLGTTAYLGDAREGLTIVDCSDPANPQRVGNYFSPAALQQAAPDGDKLYVTDYSYGVSIVDVSDPRSPSLAGQWETGTYTPDRRRMNNWGIAVRDDLAYVAAGYAGLQVLDVADPASPSLSGSFPLSYDTRSVGLALSPDASTVHVGLIPGASIVNLNVSDLSNIVNVGSVDIGASSTGPVTIARRSDGIAYIAQNNMLVTVDLGGPEGPSLLGAMPVPSTLDLTLDGDHLYAANESGLDIFNVATPDHLPLLEGHYGSEEAGEYTLESLAVAVSGERAYLGTVLALEVIDVSTPARPVPLAKASSAGLLISDLIVNGPNVYVITRNWEGGGAGVLVYEVSAEGFSTVNLTFTSNIRGVTITGDEIGSISVPQTLEARIGDSFTNLTARQYLSRTEGPHRFDSWRRVEAYDEGGTAQWVELSERASLDLDLMEDMTVQSPVTGEPEITIQAHYVPAVGINIKDAGALPD